MHITKSPSLPPPFFAYCKRSKSGGWKGLGTRLICNCSSLFISVPYLNCTISKAVVKALALVWSIAYSVFVPCGLKIGDTTFLKQYVLCNIKQRLKLQKSSKETVRCRDHPCRSFRMPRNKDSQNMNPLESPETILSTFELWFYLA